MGSVYSFVSFNPEQEENIMDDVQRWMAQISLLVYLVLNVVFWPVVIFSVGWLLWKAFTDQSAISALWEKIRNLVSTDKSKDRQTKTEDSPGQPKVTSEDSPKQPKVTSKDTQIVNQDIRIAKLEKLVEQYANTPPTNGIENWGSETVKPRTKTVKPRTK